MCDDGTVDFSREAVRKKLMKLTTDISPGPDVIHPMLLKECASAVAEPLSLIVVKLFDTRTLPDDRRKAHIVPILKKVTRPTRLTTAQCHSRLFRVN